MANAMDDDSLGEMPQTVLYLLKIGGSMLCNELVYSLIDIFYMDKMVVCSGQQQKVVTVYHGPGPGVN